MAFPWVFSFRTLKICRGLGSCGLLTFGFRVEICRLQGDGFCYRLVLHLFPAFKLIAHPFTHAWLVTYRAACGQSALSWCVSIAICPTQLPITAWHQPPGHYPKREAAKFEMSTCASRPRTTLVMTWAVIGARRIPSR